ncbi:hypothetical protein ACPW96_16490 [Micromonospora sp. DT81.3]|uniref:hypothetical protein n=1 Tax=Actinomycetes TaxID=1760 RepID=UPI003CF5E2A4
MKRIDIRYGGDTYSVGGRDLEELRQEILTGLDSGKYWLIVNDGEGMRRDAQLLITPGVPISLIPIPSPEEEAAGDVGR